MNDVEDPYEFKEDAMGENFKFGNDETESNGSYFKILPQILQSYREDNERMLKAQEDQNQINACRV